MTPERIAELRSEANNYHGLGTDNALLVLDALADSYEDAQRLREQLRLADIDQANTEAELAAVREEASNDALHAAREMYAIAMPEVQGASPAPTRGEIARQAALRAAEDSR